MEGPKESVEERQERREERGTVRQGGEGGKDSVGKEGGWEREEPRWATEAGRAEE